MQAGEASVAALIHALPSKDERNFHGPLCTTGEMTDPSDEDALLGLFADAQRTSGGLVPEWCDCKIKRKDVWRQLGVPELVIVPTLYNGELLWDGSTLDDVPEFTVDADGNYMPCLEQPTPVQTAADAHCKSTLRTVLTREQRVAVKPARGANSKGVLLCSLGAEATAVRGESQLVSGRVGEPPSASSSSPSASACSATHIRAAASQETGAARSDEGETELRVWVQTPQKQHKREGGTERVTFDERALLLFFKAIFML